MLMAYSGGIKLLPYNFGGKKNDDSEMFFFPPRCRGEIINFYHVKISYSRILYSVVYRDGVT